MKQPHILLSLGWSWPRKLNGFLRRVIKNYEEYLFGIVVVVVMAECKKVSQISGDITFL